MEETIIGIECSLDESIINYILGYLAREDYEMFVPWRLASENEEDIVPQGKQDFYMLEREIRALETIDIWEMVMQLWPRQDDVVKINTYEEFLNCGCFCCLIYYDCGELEIYAKSEAFLLKCNDILSQNGVSVVKRITYSNLTRSVMYP